jgi:hypothetical protein
LEMTAIDDDPNQLGLLARWVSGEAGVKMQRGHIQEYARRIQGYAQEYARHIREYARPTGFGRRPAAVIGCSVLFAFAAAGAEGADAPAPAPQAQKLPGATGVISGQTPSQTTQASQAPLGPADTGYDSSDWWNAGGGTVLNETAQFVDPLGKIGLINASGAIATQGHPFFEPIGKNGRACVTCHQPAYGMSVSVEALQARWKATQGKDPVFAPVDGSNCPSAPQADEKSHSLLLEHGLFRIFLPWPPKAADGSSIEPEFDLEVISDPTGCNTDPVYGLHSANPQVSIFRRPRVVANIKYVVSGGGPAFNIKDGSPMVRDPETGKFVNMNLMADAREPSPRTQAVNAALTHLQSAAPPSDEQLRRIVEFENQLYVASVFSNAGGSLIEEGGPTALGPAAMQRESPGLGDNFYKPVFGYFDQWTKPTPSDPASEFRASVARGMEVFFTRPFYIRDVTHLNTVGLGNPIKRTCATCHNARMTGMDTAPGWMDLGTANRPWSSDLPMTDELPLFKLTCHSSRAAHPYLGAVILTHDPGRALISGRCLDIGAITMQQFRGLAARAPYFSNGSAATLRDLVDYYDKRFEANYSEREKQDLVNFLGVL